MTSCHFCVCLFLFPCVFCFLFYFVVSLSWYVVPTSRVFTSCRGDCVPQFLMCFTWGQLPLPSLCLYISLCVPLCVCRFVLVSPGFYSFLYWSQPCVFEVFWFTLSRQHPRTEPPCSLCVLYLPGLSTCSPVKRLCFVCVSKETPFHIKYFYLYTSASWVHLSLPKPDIAAGLAP